MDRRSTRDAARQFVSDIETEGVAVMTDSGSVERAVGVVKFYNSEKGFGFARREGGAVDVFIHANALKRSGIEDPVKTGDKLEFDVVPVDGKGPKASQIKLLPK